MKKILIVLFVFLALFSQAQLTNVNDFKVANATTAFGRNIPIGTKVYNVATGDYWVATAGITSTSTLTTASASFTRLNGAGTVTNIATGLGLTGGPITTTGTVTLDTASTVVLSRQRAANTYQPKGSYLTSFTEADPIFGAHTVKNISNGTGFLKNTAGTWSYDNSTYSLSSHTHTGTYEPAITAGTTAQFWRGDKSWQTLNTTAVTEGTNLYYTEARVNANANVTAAYTNRITSLTTTGSSGAATLLSNTLNIPNYTLSGLGGVPTSRTLTINGTTYDLSADRSWTISAGGVAWGGITGTLSDQTDLNSALSGKQATLISGTNIKTINGSSVLGSGDLVVSSMVYPGAGIPISTGSAWGTSITDNSANWNTAYSHSQSAHQTIINGTGFVKASGTTLSYDNSTYLTEEIDGSISNEGAISVTAGGASSSVLHSNTSGSTDVTINVAGINTISETASSITITATEVDGSTTNEIEVVDEAYSSANFNGGTTSAVSQDDFYDYNVISDTDDDGLPNKADLASAGFVKSDASGNLSVDGNTYLTTEVDGSVSNEGSLTVAAGTATTSIINSNTSGQTGVTLEAGTNITISETGNTITIAASGGGGTPGGSSGQVQYNSSGTFAGDADLTFDGNILTTKVQKLIVQNGSKTANWTHDAALGDIGAYRVNLASSTISIHNLASGMQGTIFLNYVTTTPTTLTVNTFSDAGTTGLTEVVLGGNPTMAINKSTSVTYTCASDGTNTYVYLVYGQQP